MVTIIDDRASGDSLRSFKVAVPSHRSTVREIIRARVREEVERFNQKSGEVFHGLVQPNDSEPAGDGYRLPRLRTLDWQQQYDRAITAFQQNGFFVICDDKQIDDLDQIVELTEKTEVHFLKLVPLVGG